MLSRDSEDENLLKMFVQRTRYLESGKNLDEIFFWAEAVILSQLARDCSAWSYSLDEIAVNANESFREWAFVLFLPRTSNNLSQTRRPACQECHKSSRKLGREDKWFLDFDCKTLIFDLRLWLWDFDCRNSKTAASSPFRVMTRSPRWWRAIPLNDEPPEGNVDPANVDRSFLSPFLTQINHRPNVPAAVMLVPFQDVKQGTIRRHVAVLFNTLDRFNEGESPKTVPIRVDDTESL